MTDAESFSTPTELPPGTSSPVTELATNLNAESTGSSSETTPLVIGLICLVTAIGLAVVGVATAYCAVRRRSGQLGMRLQDDITVNSHSEVGNAVSHVSYTMMDMGVMGKHSSSASKDNTISNWPCEDPDRVIQYCSTDHLYGRLPHENPAAPEYKTVYRMVGKRKDCGDTYGSAQAVTRSPSPFVPGGEPLYVESITADAVAAISMSVSHPC